MRCKGVYCVDLGESFQMSIYLLNSVSIQLRLRSFSGVGGDSPLPSFLKNIRNSLRFAMNESYKVRQMRVSVRRVRQLGWTQP